MTTTVYVSEADRIGRGVNIGFLSVFEGRTVAHKPQVGADWTFGEQRDLRPGELFPDEYVLRLTGDEARALLESLIRYFHGAEDTRALRKDYDHEKQRVDKLIDSMIARAVS